MLKDGEVAAFSPFRVQLLKDIPGTTSVPRDDGGQQFVAASLCLSRNICTLSSADTKGILTSAHTDTACRDFEE